MQVFADVALCIAPDTPGYGLSDMTEPVPASLDDYAQLFIEFVDALGIEQFHVYGAATGGQVAIALAKNHPARVLSVLLDYIGHFDEAEQDDMLDGNFPSVAPCRDGGHLLTYWEMVRHLYLAFPWQSLRPRVIVTDPIPYQVDEPAAFKSNGLADISPAAGGTHLLRAWYQVRESARSWPWFDTCATARRKEAESVSVAEWHDRSVELLTSAAVYPALQRATIAHDWLSKKSAAQRRCRSKCRQFILALRGSQAGRMLPTSSTPEQARKIRQHAQLDRWHPIRPRPYRRQGPDRRLIRASCNDTDCDAS